VQPGDVIVADSDGIIVIPPALVAQVAADAAAQEAQDAWVLEQVEAGNAIEGLFPPTGEWKAKYEAHKAALADQASTAVGHENGKEEK
jgi:hypothetical protein